MPIKNADYRTWPGGRRDDVSILHTPGAQSGTARVHGRPVVQNTDYIGNGAGLMDFVWRLQGRLGDYRREWRRLRAGGGAAGIQNP